MGELRVIALLRTRGLVLAVGAVAFVAGVGLILRNGGGAEGALGLLALSGLMLPLFVAHGLVGQEIASGVALLWLQKPIQPVTFFFRRWLEATGLILVLIALLGGVAAMVVAAFDSPESGQRVLRGILSPLPPALVTSSILFALSAWGVARDSLIALLLCYASFFVRVRGEGLVADTADLWAIPMDELFTVVSLLGGNTVGHVPHSMLIVVRYAAMWIAVACVGVAYTTRSPLPRESAR